MKDKSILLRLEEQGHDAPRVQLKGGTGPTQGDDRYEVVGEVARGGRLRGGSVGWPSLRLPRRGWQVRWSRWLMAERLIEVVPILLIIDSPVSVFFCMF